MLSSALTFREMLSTARNPVEYRLRTVVGLAATVLMSLVLLRENADPRSGLPLFAAIHGTVTIILLILPASLTADLISRERREGTLDLLFLTPLTGTQIVSSKLFTQTLRTIVIWLSTLPIATVPLLSGGISPALIAVSLCVQFCCLTIGLMSGIAVSCFVSIALAAILLSIGLTLLLTAANYSLVFGAVLGSFHQDILVNATAALSSVLNLPMLLMQGRFLGLSALSTIQIFARDTALIAVSALVLTVLLGRVLARHSHRGAPSAAGRWLYRVFLTPAVLKDRLEMLKRRKMEKNPFLWLEYRNAWSRSLRSILAGLVILVESYLLLFSREFMGIQVTVAMILLLIVAVTASAAFRREKENGAFELLLVSPLTEERLIMGRLRAVWSYYTPAGLVFAFMFLISLDLQQRDLFDIDPQLRIHLLSLALSAITVPVTGLYLALTRRNFAAILISTAVYAIFIPFFAWDAVRLCGWLLSQLFSMTPWRLFFDPEHPTPLSGIATALLHFYLIKRFSTATIHVLRERTFAL